VVGVEQWAEIRRMHFVAGLSIKEIARRTGRDRNTVRRALRSQEPPRCRRSERPSKLEPFREEIHRLLGEDGELPGQVIRERLQELGYAGGKTILDDYLREIRPIVSPPRTFQRTVYRPAQTCQFDLWEPSNKVPVGAVEHRRGWVVVACLGYSRAGAGALIFSKQTPDLLWGIARCLWQLGGLPRTLVWDRQAGLCTPGGQPTEEFAALCGRLRVGWHFCRRRDPQAKGAVERLQGYLETNFEPGPAVRE
jgi:transposase